MKYRKVALATAAVAALLTAAATQSSVAAPAATGDSSKAALEAASDRPLFAADDGPAPTADQIALGERVTDLVTPANENERDPDGVPPQFKRGIVGFTGGEVEGFTAVVGKGMDLASAKLSVLGGVSSKAASNLSVRSAAHSTAELEQVWRGVRAYKWSSADPTYALDVDPASGRIEVTAGDSLTDQDRAGLQKLGGDAIEFVHSGQLSRMSRSNDNPPHYGGANIVRSDGSSCSSGFTVKTGGGTYHSLTAGHCGPNGTAFYATSFFGNIGGNSGFPDYDQARLSTSTYTNRIYTDGGDNFASRLVTGANDGAIDQSVCASGKTSGSICGISIRSLTSTFCSGGCTTYLGKGRKTTQNPAAPGDSGGPVYLRNTDESRATVKGIVIGGDGVEYVWWERYESLAGHLSVTAVTSP